jgi:GNAT superfamily N-acetyltransferase
MNETARLADTGDLRALEQLAADARAEALTKRGGVVLVERDLPGSEALADAYDALVVGLIDDVVVGYGAITCEAMRIGKPLGVIGELYVDPGAREVGIGEAMMDLLITWSRERGCRGVDAKALPGDRATKNFFETFGLVARAIEVHRSIEEP